MTESNIDQVIKKYGKLIPKKKREILKKELDSAPDEAFEKIMSTPTKNLHLTHIFSILLGPLGIDRIYLGDNGIGVLKVALGVFVLAIKNGYDIESAQKNNDIGQYSWLIPAMIGLYGLYIVADVALAYFKAKNINADLILSAVSDSHFVMKSEEENSQDASAEAV